MSVYASPSNNSSATLRGIRRAKGIAPNGKSPILTSLLRQMVEVLPDDLSGLRDKAILLIGFAGAFRRSEIVSLHVRGIQSGDAGLIITLRRSKTDQEGASFTKGIPIGTTDATCPKCALEAWLQLVGITSGPIFRPVDRWGHVGHRAMNRRCAWRVQSNARSQHFTWIPRTMAATASAQAS